MVTRKRATIALAVTLSLIAVLYLSSGIWLSALGESLVENTSPSPADAVLVLAGDLRGNRLLKACELLHAGLAPVVLVSGSQEMFGKSEAHAAVEFAASRGCPADRLEPIATKATSTVTEANLLRTEIVGRSIDNLIVVTSNYHSARSGRVFRNEFGDSVRIQMVASPDRYFKPETWWHTREGQKTVFLEVSKTIAHWIGL